MEMRNRKPILCWIWGKRDSNGEYRFTVDSEQNINEDAIQIVEPYYEEKEINGIKTYLFGYRYSQASEDFRKACSLYLENVQGTPEILDDETGELYIPEGNGGYGISEHDLYTMVERALRNIQLSDFNIDTIVYPTSGPNRLNSYLNRCVIRYFREPDRLTYYEVLKAEPKSVQFDFNWCLSDVESGRIPDTFFDMNENSVPITYDNLAHFMDAARSLPTFSIRKLTKSIYLRKYFRDFNILRKVDRTLLYADRVLIVDDKTNVASLPEIIRVIREYNNDCGIYVFTID